LFGPIQCRRIVEAPVQLFRRTEKDRARFARAVAYRDDVIEILAVELRDRLRPTPEMSMPSSRITTIASGRTVPGLVPALSASNRFPASYLSSPSAI
jgi:hypothetical protein